MKKILFIIVAILIFSSCEDYLELSPDFGLDETIVFNDYNSIRGYLDNAYNAMFDYTFWNSQNAQRPHVACLSDEAITTYPFSTLVEVMNGGDWFRRDNAAEVGYGDNQVGNTNGRVISNSFYSLRIVNKVIDKVPDISALSQNQKDMLLGQAHFLRAWHYFEIIRRWGGMPLFDKAYTPNDDLDFERKSYQESTEWLISDLEKAYEFLPLEWPENETGRANKAAAKALKSMAALYAASPLMANDLNSTQYLAYNTEWAEKAAQYAYETLDFIDKQMPSKKLVGENASNQQERDSMYRHIFYHYPNFVSDEALWYNNRIGMNNAAREVDLAIHFQNIRFSGRGGNYGWAHTDPTQNLVDMFERVNPNDNKAYPIEHPASGYTLENPYENRDPRFYNNILYAGRQHGTDAQNNPLYFEPWQNGGKDYASDWTKSVPTGYLCIKWWWPEANFAANPKTAAYNLYYYSCNYIRTSQVFLDYAEAMNEAYGPNSDPKAYGMTAVQAINRLRARVGMPEVLAEFTASKEAFRDRIRNERAVELMYENHRWFDIRRWMIADKLFNPQGELFPIKGMKVTDNTPEEADVANKSFSYEVVSVEVATRVFDLKHYWYPVAADHSDRLGNFKQNPGW